MKRALLSLAAAGAIALSQAAAVTPQVEAAAPVQMLPSVLNQMERAGKSLQTLEAGIKQVKRDTMLDATDKSTGTFYYKKGAPGQERILLEYVEPARQTIAIVGDRVTIYQAFANQVLETTRQAQAGKNKSLNFLGLGYGQAAQQFREKYTITLVGADTIDGRQTTLLDLKPKTAEHGIKRISVWVDNATWLPVQYVLKESGAETTVSLSSMKPNVKLDDSKFEIKVPSGVQRMQG